MNVTLVDLKAQYHSIQAEIDQAVWSVLESTRFVGGPEVGGFESEFAEFCGAAHCVGLSSGTAALLLALEACGVGPGDEVITTTHTFVATAEAVAKLGARPVLVDVDEATGTIDTDMARKAVTGRTKAVLPVHLYGHPADMDPLLDLCNEYGFTLVEDAAQAQGTLYKGRRTGSMGRVGCFSFYPGKNLGAYGDAGAIVTEDAELASRVAILADHGRTPGTKYEHSAIGFNHRLDAIQAAILRVKLLRLDGWNERRRAVAARYTAALAGTTIGTPAPANWAVPIFHIYAVRVPPGRRSAIQASLAKAGIATGVHYPIPVHLQPAFAYLGYGRGAFPVAETLADSVLSLPMYAELTDEMVDYVVDHLIAAVDGG
ncbi:MAG: DegT/DnrJ/EryC1/StrS family aminotransferase [Anaerolineae bacterium]